MSKINAYILHHHLMRKVGQPGYMPGQAQAKEAIEFMGKPQYIDQTITVEVMDEALRLKVLELSGVKTGDPSSVVALTVEWFAADTPTQCFLVVYYYDFQEKKFAARTVSNYISNDEQYKKAINILTALAAAE